MSLPCIAIVGRPNVGKSSLLNLLARERISIVDPTPGVTRDRVSIIIDLEPSPEKVEELPPKTVEIIDTGGYGIYSSDDEGDINFKSLRANVEYQIGQAVQKADLILFVVDGPSGLMPLDYTVAEILRDQNVVDHVQVIANKVDGEGLEASAYEAASLGFGVPWLVSAKVGYNKRRFMNALYDAVPASGGERYEEIMKLAIVGKRNAGKSTLVNQLAGEERVIVSEIPGTTRDSVDVRFEIGDKSIIAIDTAGVRKKKSLQSDVEFYSQNRAMKSIRRSNVVILLIDATLPISQVDKKLGMVIVEHYKPCVLVINKWDLTEGKLNTRKQPITPEDYIEYLSKELTGLEYAPCVFISAKKGEGVRDAVAMAYNLFEQAGHRESTGQLNAVMKNILEKRGPSSRLGKQAKILYASQVTVHPPTIVMVVNHKELFEGQYEKYLLNRLREQLAFSEVPIRLLFRDRKRISLNELKTRPRKFTEDDLFSDDDDYDRDE